MTLTNHALFRVVGLSSSTCNSVSSFSSSSFSEYEYDVVGIVGSDTWNDWYGGWELDWGTIRGWLVEDILTFKVLQNKLVRYS